MILVYGPIDRQAKRLARAGVVVLRKDQLPRGCGDVTAIVLAIKFIDHKTERRLVKLYGRDRIHRVYGGDSRLREKIEELLTKKGE